MRPSISLLVAVYRRPDFLERIFTSLENQTFADFELLIADDGSGPEIAELVQRWQGRFHRPILHAWHEDRGFRKTIIVNRAVVLSSGPYLVFIDGDSILHHRFLERHHCRRRPRQLLAGRRVMLDAGLTASIKLEDVRTRRIERPTRWWLHVKPHDRRNGFFLPALFGWRGGFTDHYGLLGSNFSLFREDFLHVNGYDERIVGRGMEDINLRTRLLNAGIAVRCLSQEALQYHCHHENAGMPHDAKAVERWSATRETWIPYGVIKGARPPA